MDWRSGNGDKRGAYDLVRVNSGRRTYRNLLGAEVLRNDDDVAEELNGN